MLDRPRAHGVVVTGLLLAATACSGDVLAPGNYRLSFQGADGWSQDMRFEVEPDGSFVTHALWSATDLSGPPELCAGTLHPSEHERLSEALNEADALFRGDAYGQGCTDQPVYRVTVTMTDDGEDLRRHSFRYGPCGSWSAPMRRLLETANDIEHAHISTGACTGCAPHPALGDDCLRDPTSPGDLCRRGQRVECDEQSAGSVITCPLVQRECDPNVGWQAVLRLDFLEATLWRWTDAGTPRLRLVASLQASNPRSDDADILDQSSRLHFLDGDGTELPVDDLVMAPLPPLAPGSFATLSVTIDGIASPALLEADVLTVALAPRGDHESVDNLSVTVVDGSP